MSRTVLQLEVNQQAQLCGSVWHWNHVVRYGKGEIRRHAVNVIRLEFANPGGWAARLYGFGTGVRRQCLANFALVALAVCLSCASGEAAESGPWPVPGCGRMYLSAADGQHLSVGVASAGFSGTWTGPYSGWLVLPAGLAEVSCGVGSAVSQEVAEGETWVAWPTTSGACVLEQGSNGVLSAWAEGFGFGLTLFGFGWVYRLTKKIPGNW